MVSGEFISKSSLHKTLSYLVPHPYASGTYALNLNIHSFLCGFVDVNEDLPDVEKLASGLTELYINCVNSKSKYGFYMPTLQGTIPQGASTLNELRHEKSFFSSQSDAFLRTKRSRKDVRRGA